jgi:carbon-monoxide dehydrogenase small subunit
MGMAKARRSTRAKRTRMGRENGGHTITLTVNGQPYTRVTEPRVLLVDFLRDDLRLTGTHVGCDTSHCGACTVLLDGRAVKSCTMLAVQADGRTITTIEGLAEHGRLHPIQEAFKEHHGLQCGFCTPGVVLAALELLRADNAPSEDRIRTAISGNICRCTGYQNIVDSVAAAGERMKSGKW